MLPFKKNYLTQKNANGNTIIIDESDK